MRLQGGDCGRPGAQPPRGAPGHTRVDSTVWSGVRTRTNGCELHVCRARCRWTSAGHDVAVLAAALLGCCWQEPASLCGSGRFPTATSTPAVVPTGFSGGDRHSRMSSRSAYCTPPAGPCRVEGPSETLSLCRGSRDLDPRNEAEGVPSSAALLEPCTPPRWCASLLGGSACDRSDRGHAV